MTDNSTSKPMLKIKEAAALLNVSESTVRRRIDDKSLNSHKLKRSVRIDPDDLEEYRRSCSTAGRADRRSRLNETGKPQTAENAARSREATKVPNEALGEALLPPEGPGPATALPKTHRRRKKVKLTAAQSRQIRKAGEAFVSMFEEASSRRWVMRKRYTPSP